jgi:hypothetical protein
MPYFGESLSLVAEMQQVNCLARKLAITWQPDLISRSGRFRNVQRRAVQKETALSGAPGEIRTPDPQIRSLVLYPAELRARRVVAIDFDASWQGDGQAVVALPGPDGR